MYGKDGNDLLATEEFKTNYSNYLHGGKGDDTLIGNSKTGYWGDEGDEVIVVNTQASSSGATGGAGDDYFEVNWSNVTVNGGAGEDEFNVTNLSKNAECGIAKKDAFGTQKVSECIFNFTFCQLIWHKETKWKTMKKI